MYYLAQTHCCKRPNYDFDISKDNVATVLRRDKTITLSPEKITS